MNRRTRPLKEGKRGPQRLAGSPRNRLLYHLRGYLEHNKKLQISFPTSQRSPWFTQEFYCWLLKYYSGFEVQSLRSNPICLAWLPQAQHSAPSSPLPAMWTRTPRFKSGWVWAGFWGQGWAPQDSLVPGSCSRADKSPREHCRRTAQHRCGCQDRLRFHPLDLTRCIF